MPAPLPESFRKDIAASRGTTAKQVAEFMSDRKFRKLTFAINDWIDADEPGPEAPEYRAVKKLATRYGGTRDIVDFGGSMVVGDSGIPDIEGVNPYKPSASRALPREGHRVLGSIGSLGVVISVFRIGAHRDLGPIDVVKEAGKIAPEPERDSFGDIHEPVYEPTPIQRAAFRLAKAFSNEYIASTREANRGVGI